MYKQQGGHLPQASMLIEISKKHRNNVILIEQEGKCEHEQMTGLMCSKDIGRCQHTGVHWSLPQVRF